MPLSFISGYVTGTGAIECHFTKIASKYLRTWFGLDLIVVSVDWLELVMTAAAESLGFARFGKASRVFRILRMIRLLRLARMTEVLNLLTERLDSEKLVILIDVIKLMIFMVGSGHFIACVWYAIGNADDTERNWLVQEGFKDLSLGFQYVMSLRWAMSQFSGGMDEVTPHSMGENVYAIFVFLGAFWSGAVFLSILTSSMTQWYLMGSQQAQQLTVLRRYLSQNSISKKLALRVQRNAQHALKEQQRTMPEKDVPIIFQVSEPLRVEIHFEMYSPPLCIHPFFVRYSQEHPHIVRRICHTACAHNHVSQGDTIFNIGETPKEPKMYILLHGLLAYKRNAEDVVKAEGDQWVAEAALYVKWTHRGTLSAAHDCGMFTLFADEFQSIVLHFEHTTAINPVSYAWEFVNQLNMLEDESDLLDRDFMSSYLGLDEEKPKSRLYRTTVAARGARVTKKPNQGFGSMECMGSMDASAWAYKSEPKRSRVESLSDNSPCKESRSEIANEENRGPEALATIASSRKSAMLVCTEVSEVEEVTSKYTSMASSANTDQQANTELAGVEQTNYKYKRPPAGLKQNRRKQVAIADPAIPTMDTDECYASDRWAEEVEV